MTAKLADYLGLLRPQTMARWSIGIYAGPSPFQLTPYPGPAAQPVLSPRSLGAIKADGVADPFMVRFGNQWLMFFEVENLRSGKGEVGLATSPDALSWQFQGIVLAEPFHLSYPQVIEDAGSWYLLPEAAASGGTRLYQADASPTGPWHLVTVLIDVPLVDPTLFRHDDRWWLLALKGFRGEDELVLYHADRLAGPWRPHRANPLLRRDRRAVRPAGRVIRHQGALIRFSQDYTEYYGRRVRAFAIDQLSPYVYDEHELDLEILSPSGQGWNASGMHHLDAHPLAPKGWIACVDGRRTKLKWPIWDRFLTRMAK